MRYLCLDVEAVAIDGVETYLEPVSAPDNYKNPDAIAAYQAKARAGQIDKAALDVDLARIVALGVRQEHGSVDVMRCVDEAAEKFALTTLWRRYYALGSKFVTFNGLGYDLPLLLRRSLYLGIDAPQIQLDRFKHPQVIDLMAILSMDGKLKYHGLNFYAARFGLPLEPDIQGSEIGAAYLAGDWDSIERHCRNDVNTTWALAQRIGVVPTAAEIEKRGAVMTDPSLFDPDYTLTLTDREIAEDRLMRPLGPAGGNGGNQGFARELQDRLVGHSMVLQASELDKAFRYAWGYGGGGWQDAYFHPIVAAGLRAGWRPPGHSNGDPVMQRAINAFLETQL